MQKPIKGNPWPVNVIIMAGGKGTRLSELTSRTPKSMIEIDGKPIIHHLIAQLATFGVSTIHISVGHLSEQIIDSLSDGSDFGVCIKYIMENKPMGSIGSLTLPPVWEHEDFLVINGDIFTNFNIRGLVSEFYSKNVDLAVLTLKDNLEIPWGVFNINPDGEIVHLTEKPRYQFDINAGVYVFNSKILKLLAYDRPVEGWEMIKNAIDSGYKVFSIPLENAYWIDIGTPETLLKARQMRQMMISTN